MRWMDLETVIQSEVRKRKTNTICLHIYMELKKKNGSEEPRGRTGIKTQTYRMDLRTREEGRVSWDEVQEWHGLTYTPKCKIES